MIESVLNVYPGGATIIVGGGEPGNEISILSPVTKVPTEVRYVTFTIKEGDVFTELTTLYSVYVSVFVVLEILKLELGMSFIIGFVLSVPFLSYILKVKRVVEDALEPLKFTPPEEGGESPEAKNNPIL
jgi:hypothetical protein